MSTTSSYGLFTDVFTHQSLLTRAKCSAPPSYKRARTVFLKPLYELVKRAGIGKSMLQLATSRTRAAFSRAILAYSRSDDLSGKVEEGRKEVSYDELVTEYYRGLVQVLDGMLDTTSEWFKELVEAYVHDIVQAAGGTLWSYIQQGDQSAGEGSPSHESLLSSSS